MVSIKNKKRLYTIITILTIFLVGIVSLTKPAGVADANIFCGSMGSNMDSNRANNYGLLANSDSKNRKWTAFELFGKSTGFTSYYGEGEKSLFVKETISTGQGSSQLKSLWDDAAVKTKLESTKIRGELRCSVSSLGNTAIANLALVMSGAAVSASSWGVGSVLGEDCLSAIILKIVGGEGLASGAGLIDTLRTSLYTPLVVIVVLMGTATIIHKGLIKRE